MSQVKVERNYYLNPITIADTEDDKTLDTRPSPNQSIADLRLAECPQCRLNQSFRRLCNGIPDSDGCLSNS